MTYKTMLALASAVLLSASGAAIAAENHAMGNGHTSVNGQVTPRVNAEHPVDQTDRMQQESTPMTELQALPDNTYLKGIRNGEMVPNDRALLDAPVLSATGQQIGEVTRITPDGVVITVGHEMGIGGHQVMLKPEDLTATRQNGKLAVISSLNSGQLDKMPAYRPGGAEAAPGR